jgi:hypothetical protein
MKLTFILKRNFIVPLVICLVCTSIIVFLVNIYLCSYYYSDNEFRKKIKSGKDSSVTLVLTLMQELLYERIQLVFDYLITTKAFLDKYHSEFNPEDTNFNDPEYYSKYLISVKSLYMGEIDNIYKQDKMSWFINEKDDTFFGKVIQKSNSEDYLQKKYLFLFTKIVPIF